MHCTQLNSGRRMCSENNMRLCSAMMIFWVASSGVVFISLLCGVEGKNSIRCSHLKEANTTLRPSTDSVRARYVLEWCTHANPNVTQWKMDVLYDRFNRNPRYNKHKHSAKVETLNWTEALNCDHVCLSTSLDLVFNSSYTVQNWFPQRGSQSDITNHYIVNKYRRDDFSKYRVKGSDIYHGDYVSVHFLLDNIPAEDFYVLLCSDAKDSNHSGHHEEFGDCADVTANCSTPYSAYEVVCRLQLPNGHYRVKLNFDAAWVSSDFLTSYEYFRDLDVVSGVVTSIEDDSPWRWASGALWAGACAATLLAAAALLALALRCRRAQRFRKQVLREWLHREESKQVSAESQPVGPVLLLYARECRAAEPVISALNTLLETVAPGQVYDICSPETLALSAHGGGAWLRGLMAQPDARVVLLQTPALQVLHTPRLVTDSGVPRLEQPLLSSRAVYREPAAGDWLLQFGLRLLADTSHAPGAQPYRKYYLATLEGLETEALPYTVPFRRYVLPRHATTLLRDLRPTQQQEQQQQEQQQQQPQQHQHSADELARAVTDFVDYSRANPDYLMEELLIL